MLRALFVSIGVVEDELMVLNVLGDAVHFDLGFVHLNPGVEAADRINFSSDGFLFEQGAFTHAHTDVHAVRTDMVQGATYLSTLLRNHLVEIEVTHLAGRYGRFLPGDLLLFLLFHFFPTLGPLLLHLLYVLY